MKASITASIVVLLAATHGSRAVPPPCPPELCNPTGWGTVGGDLDAHHGQPVVPAGDVDGDGRADLLVAASHVSSRGSRWWGRASLFRGAPGGLETTAPWTKWIVENEGWAGALFPDLRVADYAATVGTWPAPAGWPTPLGWLFGITVLEHHDAPTRD